MGEPSTIKGLWHYIEYLQDIGSEDVIQQRRSASSRQGKTKKQRKAEYRERKKKEHGEQMSNRMRARKSRDNEYTDADDCRECHDDEPYNLPSVIPSEDNKNKDVDFFVVSFVVQLPRTAYSAFREKLTDMGFTDIDVVCKKYSDTILDDPKKRCPMGYRGRIYPWCGYKTCTYFDYAVGCDFHGRQFTDP